MLVLSSRKDFLSCRLTKAAYLIFPIANWPSYIVKRSMLWMMNFVQRQRPPNASE